MTRRLNFAPVSSAQSSLLRFASGYFMLNGVVYGLLVAALLIAYALGREVFVPTLLTVLNIVIQVITAVGLVWTGLLLGRGTRLGGVLALGFSVLPIAFAALTPDRIDTTSLVFGVLGVIAFSMIWHELK